jgi:hypothetical protein
VRHVKLFDAEHLEAPAGKLKQRGAAHPSKADYNCVVHGWFPEVNRGNIRRRFARRSDYLRTYFGSGTAFTGSKRCALRVRASRNRTRLDLWEIVTRVEPANLTGWEQADRLTNLNLTGLFRAC